MFDECISAVDYVCVGLPLNSNVYFCLHMLFVKVRTVLYNTVQYQYIRTHLYELIIVGVNVLSCKIVPQVLSTVHSYNIFIYYQ